MTILYGIKSCDTCRNALRWLEEHRVEHEFHDIRADGLNEELLDRWQDELGWESLVNKRSITWRKIPPVDRESLDAESAAQLILSYPTVMRRPVVDTGETVLLGFDESAFSAAFASGRGNV